MYSYQLSLSQAKRVCRLDSQGDPEFVKQNVDQVVAMTTVWFAIMQDAQIPESLISVIYDSINAYGLIRNVEACEEVTQFLLEGFTEGAGYFEDPTTFSGHFASTRYLSFAFAQAVESICMLDPDLPTIVKVRRVLQVLEFPKRFTYISSSSADSSIIKFLKVNGKCRLHDADWSTLPGEAIQDALREELEYILGACGEVTYENPDFDHGFRLVDADMRQLARIGGFSSGSTHGGIRKLPLKWEVLSSYFTNYRGIFGYPLPKGKNLQVPMSIPTLIGVPKSFNSKRVIAPEHAFFNYIGGGALEILRATLASTGNDRFINEHDQSINRELALEGSLSGEWCTIDMSSASDSISRYIFFRCIPQVWKSFYAFFLSWYITYQKGKKTVMRRLHTLLTSGCRITWLTEAIWFLGIARVGCRLAGVDRFEAYAYGDDLIVKREAYETTLDLLEAFGHTVNRRKSYGSGLFRESCGIWAYRGMDVTPVYWPRRTVSPGNELISVLCDLQHRVYDSSGMDFSQTLAAIVSHVEGLCPSITYSPVGDVCEDLWKDTVNPYLLDTGKHWKAHLFELEDMPLTPLAQHVVYYQYLECGPLYDDPLSELLGVSSSRLTGYLRVLR